MPFFNRHFNNSDGVLNFCKNRDLDSIESIIKPYCVTYHGLVGIAGIQFHVDLAVDASFALLVVILATLGFGHGESSDGEIISQVGMDLGVRFLSVRSLTQQDK